MQRAAARLGRRVEREADPLSSQLHHRVGAQGGASLKKRLTRVESERRVAQMPLRGAEKTKACCPLFCTLAGCYIAVAERRESHIAMAVTRAVVHGQAAASQVGKWLANSSGLTHSQQEGVRLISSSCSVLVWLRAMSTDAFWAACTDHVLHAHDLSFMPAKRDQYVAHTPVIIHL